MLQQEVASFSINTIRPRRQSYLGNLTTTQERSYSLQQLFLADHRQTSKRSPIEGHLGWSTIRAAGKPFRDCLPYIFPAALNRTGASCGYVILIAENTLMWAPLVRNKNRDNQHRFNLCPAAIPAALRQRPAVPLPSWNRPDRYRAPAPEKQPK